MMSDFILGSDAQQDYILVRTLGRGAFGEANLYRKIEVVPKFQFLASSTLMFHSNLALSFCLLKAKENIFECKQVV